MPTDGKPGLLDRIPAWFVPALLVAVPLLAAAAAAVQPAFYGHVVWQYYWGPIKADASNEAALCMDGGTVFAPGDSGYLVCTQQGVMARSGYNVVNTASWAVLLMACVVMVAQFLQRHEARMTPRLVVGATLWTVAGSVFHVLEDTGLMRPPLQYVFITPPIYLLFAAFGVLAFRIGKALERVQERDGLEAARRRLWLVWAIVPTLALVAWIAGWDQLTRSPNPVVVAACWLAGAAWLRARLASTQRLDAVDVVLASAGSVLLTSIYLVIEYAYAPWSPSEGGMPAAFLLVPALAGLVVIAVRLVGSRMASPALRAAFLEPVNLLVVFSQMVDAFATAVAIDFHGYGEKHVLSAALIDWTRDAAAAAGWQWGAEHATTLGFVPVKLALALLVVYAFDAKKGDTPRNENLVGLAKFAVIMVGLGPGVRDFTRLALGV